MASSGNKLEYSARMKLPKVSLIAPDKEQTKKFKSQFVGSFQKAGFQTEKSISYWLDEAMETPTWSWQGTTIRKNGSIAKTPRDIVDSGKLKASKKLTTSFGSTQVKWTVRYTEPYAALVHYGGYIAPYGRSEGTAYVPGRPWIQLVFREDANEGDSDAYNFLSEMKDRMIEELNR